MRISDWSSDVCSSDLQGAVVKNDIRRHARFQCQFPAAGAQGVEQRIADRIGRRLPFAAPLPLWRQHHRNRLLPAQDRSGIGTKLQATMLIRLQRIAQKKGAGHWLDQRAFFSTNDAKDRKPIMRSEEHTSELQSLMRISYAVFCLKKKKKTHKTTNHHKQTKKDI